MEVGDVDIGFIEESPPWKLQSRFFPSKVGGKPAWLELKDLPTEDVLQCKVCKKTLIFLCQIYAPYEGDKKNFHRTLFVFVCKNSICMQSENAKNIKVLRSHLGRENKFYSPDPPEHKYSCTIFELTQVCRVCGCLANKHCSKCKERYCSREHQIIAWKEGHKTECGIKPPNIHYFSNLLFPQYEIVIEPEIFEENIVNEEEQLEEFNKLQLNGKAGTMCDISESELEAHTSEVVKDKTFAQFQKRIKEDPQQVIRYQRGGMPLWIAEHPIPDIIPNCEYCQGPRQFEFQIMPQMLLMLKESELDWGVLCVYTCKSSCTDVDGYKNEFIFKQDVAF